jgi:UDP-glucose 4-epimerase
MSRVLAWIFGRGGLLGSHLLRAIARSMPDVQCWDCIVPSFAWSDRLLLDTQLERAVQSFAQAVRSAHRSWMVFWAAGSGVVGSSRDALAAETATWERLLNLLDGALLRPEDARQGLVFLASSAGGVYGNSPDAPLTETSLCAPISDYGRSKLAQENALRAWAGTRPAVSYLIGRISNLYGPGQNLAKPQGLISHLSRRLIYNCPVHIFVSLDSIRDYIFAEDCAEQIVQSLRFLGQRLDGERPRNKGLVKLFAGEEAISLAQIVGVFAHLANKRHPRVISAANWITKEQPRSLQFRSMVDPDVRSLSRTSLAVGIHRVYQHQLALYRQGRLPAPWEQEIGRAAH